MNYLIKKSLVFILVIIFLIGCDSKSTRPMVVSTNLWIGYSPLYYAQKKGWLRENNIKLVDTVSLAESLNLYKNDNCDMFCGTQYEINNAQTNENKSINLILFDKSDGGDYLLSNRSIEQLKKTRKINVYLEIDSVNIVLLKYFINKHNIDMSQLNLIDSSQAINSKFSMKRDATIIVTYNPYNLKLQKKGYKTVGTTKEKDLLIVDALYVSQNTNDKFPKEIEELNLLIYKSLKALNDNPKEYFEMINSYFHYKDFDEFKSSLKDVEWIYSKNKVVLENKEKLFNKKPTNLIKPYKGDS